MNLRIALSALALIVAAPCVEGQRLPKTVYPLHYSLDLTPSIEKASFEGSEVIDVMLDAPTSAITLNALELNIHSVTAGGQTAVVTYDVDKQQATFTFAQPLAAGKNSIAVSYSGVLNDKLRGFYLSKTKSRNYAVTQFESTDARRAFPSFDEPAFKASFDVSLTIDKNDTAISNGPIVKDVKNVAPGKHKLVFGTTPKMSTYLVAFLVGDFKCSKGKADGVPIRACSTPDKVKLTKFALDSAVFTLHYYDTYFGIKYPLAKLDLIGIPDFEAGAMENFGAITYRETDFLVDAKGGSIDAKKRVSQVVAHEMAHQWFGDMVTMQWWDNIWLNEGFATWMEDKAAGAWHPEWNFAQDTETSVQTTLNYDAGKTTHPIRVEANTPGEIDELFDGISYGKGGAVLGMVENYLGAEVFRQGVHTYLAAHLFANATAEDFWTAQTETSHKPVDKVLQSFVTMPGVPLLTFTKQQAAGYPVGQRRFYLSPENADEKTASSLSTGWAVPVCVKTAGEPLCKVLSPEDAVLDVPDGNVQPVFYANATGKGYYRTAYSPEQLKDIISVAETSLTPPERLSLLGDRWALTRAGQGSVGEYLDLAIALKNDPNASVLVSEVATINSISSRIATGDDLTALQGVIRKEFGQVYASLGKPGNHESYDKEEIRDALFGTLAHAQDPEVMARARQITDDLFNDHDESRRRKARETHLADEAVAVTAATGDEVLYNKLLAVSQNANADPGLQTQALLTLDGFENPDLVKRTLDYVAEGHVRNQDSWILISQLLQRPKTRTQAWAYVQEHWDKIKVQLTTTSGTRIVASTGSFCTVEQRDQVAAFFAANPMPAANRTLAQSIDSINACVQLRAAQGPKLHDWLALRAVLDASRAKP